MENNDKKEILEALSGFAQNTQDQFDSVNNRIDNLTESFTTLQKSVDTYAK